MRTSISHSDWSCQESEEEKSGIWDMKVMQTKSSTFLEQEVDLFLTLVDFGVLLNLRCKLEMPSTFWFDNWKPPLIWVEQ